MRIISLWLTLFSIITHFDACVVIQLRRFDYKMSASVRLNKICIQYEKDIHENILLKFIW